MIRFALIFVLFPVFTSGQFFSVEEEDSLKSSFNAYLNNPDKESDKAMALLKSGQINRLCSIIAESMFKSCINEFNTDLLLSTEERKLQRKIHFRIDTSTSFLATKSVSSRWVNGTPYIEYYPNWVLGFSNHLYTDLISNSNDLKRPYYNMVFKTILSVNDSLDAVAEAHLNATELSRFYSMEHILQASLTSYCSYLFIYLHEFSHLAYPGYSEIDADKFATEKILRFIDQQIPNGSESEDSLVKEKLQMDIPDNFSKYSIFYMSFQYLDYLSSHFIFTTNDYANTLHEFLSRKKILYEELSRVLRCDFPKNILTKPCQGFKTIIQNDQENFSVINEKINMVRRWELFKKESNDTTAFFKNLNPENPIAPLYTLGVMLCGQKKYIEALIFLTKAITTPNGDAATIELSNLLIGKIYQFRLLNLSKAIYHFNKAKEYSHMMPEEFYENLIKSL